MTSALHRFPSTTLVSFLEVVASPITFERSSLPTDAAAALRIESQHSSQQVTTTHRVVSRRVASPPCAATQNHRTVESTRCGGGFLTSVMNNDFFFSLLTIRINTDYLQSTICDRLSYPHCGKCDIVIVPRRTGLYS